MKRRTSKTSVHIRSINTYIESTLKAFGEHSSEYQDLMKEVRKFDIYTKANGAKAIRDTAKNRKQHQKIKSIRNNLKKKPVQALKRNAERRLKEFNRRHNTNIIKISTFERMQNDFNELQAEIYSITEEAEEYGIEYDFHRLFQDVAYRDAIKVRIQELKEGIDEEYFNADDYEAVEGFSNSDFYDMEY